MSNSIDERIVSMKFDNKQFEAGANESMSTIDKLLAKLKLTDSAEGFANLDKAAKGVDLSGLAGGVDAVTNKFSALEAVALGALMNIGNRIANMGIDLAKSLSVDQIATGLNEYEQKMGSVQTLLYNAKFDESIYDTDEKKMEKIKDIMEDLNKYSDDTIYSFGDMKSAIAKFVNAGVELDDASLAIKGIANVAALSGANAQEAGRAYYNLAQSLSTGSLKLIDWKSIENANMASIPFKQTIIDVAREMGALSDDIGGIGGGLKAADVTAENFRESISGARGATWVTNEVLLAALAKFGDKTTDIGSKAYQAATEIKTLTMLMDTLREAVQSGWAETFEIIIGDFFESKKMWTAVSDEVGGILGEQARKRNEFFADWKYYGGRQALLDSITHIWSAIKTVLTEVKAVIDKVFPALSGEQFANVTRQFLYFAKGLEFDSVELSRLRLVLNRIIPLFKIVQAAGKGLATIGSAVAKAIGKIMTAFADNVAMSDAGKELNTINDVCEKIADVAGKVAEWIGKAGDEVARFITGLRTGNYVSDFLGKLTAVYEYISGKLQPLMEKFSFEKIGKALDNYQDYIPTQEQLTGAVTDIWDKVKQAFSGQISFSDLFNDFDIFGDDLSSSEVEDKTVMIVNLSDALNSLHDSVKDIAGLVDFDIEGFKEAFKQIDWGLLTGYAFAAALVAMAFKLFKILDKVLVIAGGVAGGFSQLMVSVSGFFTRLGKSLKLYLTLAAVSNSLVKLAIAFGIIALSLKMLTKVDPIALENVSKVMWKYFLTMAIIFGVVASLTAIFSKNTVKLSTSGNMFLGIAIFVAALAFALYALAKALSNPEVQNLDQIVDMMSKFIEVLAAFVIGISIADGLIGKDKKLPGILLTLSVLIIALAASIYIVSQIGSEDFEVMAESVASMIAMIYALLLFTWILSKVKIGKDTYATILSMGVIFAAIGIAVYIFSEIDWTSLSANQDAALLALISIVVLLGWITMLGYLIGNSKGGSKVSKALFGIAAVCISIGASLLMAALAFQLLAGHEDDWKWPVTFMAGFLAVVAIFALVANKLGTMVQDAKDFAKVMLSIAASLILVAIAYRIVSKMSMAEISTGIIGLIMPLIAVITIIITLTHLAGAEEVKTGAGLIISLAALILVITAGLAILSALPIDRVMAATAGILLLILACIMIVALVALLAEKGEDNLENAKGIIIALSVFIGVFAIAMTLMSKLADTNKFIPVMIGLGVALAMLAGLIILISKIEMKDPKKAIATVAMAIIMLVAVTASLAILGQEGLNAGNMMAGMVSITVIMILLAVIIGLLSNMSGGGTNMILAATSLIMVSVAIGLIAASLWLLAKVPVESIEPVVVALGLILALAALIIFVLGSASSVIIAAATGIASLGVSLAILGLGISAIALVVPIIGLGIMAIGKGLSLIGQGIRDISDAAVYGSERLPVFFDNLKLAAISLYELLEELKEIGPTIAYDMATVGMMCVTSFLLGVAADLGMAIAAGFLIIVAFIDGIATAIDQNGGELKNAIDHLKESIKNFLFGGNGDDDSEYESLGKRIIKALFRGFSKMDAAPLTVGNVTREGIADTAVETVTGGGAGRSFAVEPEIVPSGNVEDAVVETVHAEITNGMVKAANQPVNIPPEAQRMIANNTTSATATAIREDTQIEEAVEEKASAANSYKDMLSKLQSGGDGFAEGITSGIGDKFNIGSFDDLISGEGFNLDAIKAKGYDLGGGFGEGFGEGMVSEFDFSSFMTDNMSFDSLTGPAGLMSSMFESGSGTTSDPGVISTVLSVDTDSAYSDIWGMMEETQLTKIVGENVNGKIDATYMSSAAEMSQQEQMFTRLLNTLSGDFDTSIKEMPVPETVVNVNLSADAKKMFRMTQEQSTNYHKRTGRPAYQMQ